MVEAWLLARPLTWAPQLSGVNPLYCFLHWTLLHYSTYAMLLNKNNLDMQIHMTTVVLHGDTVLSDD